MEQKVIEIWHIVQLTGNLFIGSWVFNQIWLQNPSLCGQRRMEITASLSRAKERLTFRTGRLILCTIKLCHQSKTLHTYFLSPTSAWKWSSDDAYKAWACLTSTNSFPRYGVKYKSQRWSLSTGLDSSVGGKYLKKIGVTVHEQQMSISALPKLFFSGLLQTLSEVK